MTHILQLNASFSGDASHSSRLAGEFVARWRQRRPVTTVTVRDFAQEPVPHLDGPRFAAFVTAPEARTPEQQAVVAYSDTLIQELRSADVLVIGLPMYNFGIPSQLKSYFDHVARVGETFRYTANGPEGLLQGKKAYVFATRGGRYVGTPMDTQTGYVRDFLRFLGIADVEFVYAEGLAMGEDPRREALAAAELQIDRLAA